MGFATWAGHVSEKCAPHKYVLALVLSFGVAMAPFAQAKDAAQANVVQLDATQSNTAQSDTAQSRTTQPDTSQKNAVQHHTEHRHTQHGSDTKTQQEVADTLKQVLDGDAFGSKETLTEWRPKNKPDPNHQTLSPSGFGGIGRLLAALFEFVFWAGLVCLVIYLLSRFGDWSDWLGGYAKGKRGSKAAKPTEIFGLDVTEASLPSDVAAQVRKLLAGGDYRAASALLYRAALINLIHERDIDITKAATEGQCVRLVSQHEAAVVAQGFAGITQVWQRVAYAAEVPSQSVFDAALHNYVQHFGQHATQRHKSAGELRQASP